MYQMQMSDKHTWGEITIQERDLSKKNWPRFPKKSRRKGRKNKKRSNWLARKKIKRKDRCPGCGEVTFCLSIKRGWYNIRAVPEVEYSFRTTYMCMRRWRFPGDIIAKIMSQVYSEDAITRELTRPIVFLECGCIYHIVCLEEQKKCNNCGDYHIARCDRHNKKIKIMKREI